MQVAGIKTLVPAPRRRRAPTRLLANVAINGNSSEARRAALDQLAPYAPSNPNILAVINTDAQKEDPAKEVRDFANQLLGNDTGTPQGATGTTP